LVDSMDCFPMTSEAIYMESDFNVPDSTVLVRFTLLSITQNSLIVGFVSPTVVI